MIMVIWSAKMCTPICTTSCAPHPGTLKTIEALQSSALGWASLLRGELEERRKTERGRSKKRSRNSAAYLNIGVFLSSSRQYNNPVHAGEAPKSRSLERKQQDNIVLTKWRHSTYVLDTSDKVRRTTECWSRCWVWGLCSFLLTTFSVVCVLSDCVVPSDAVSWTRRFDHW